MSLDNIKRQFANPDNRFRFAPFWFLNHELIEAETRWQVRIVPYKEIRFELQ